MIKSVLLTRTQEKNEAFINHIGNRSHNFEFISGPLLEIQYLKLKIEMNQYKAFIFTSGFAVRSLVDKIIPTNCLAYCVGSKTASEAEKAGFKIQYANGNSRDLIKLIKNTFSKNSGKIIYIRGKTVFHDITEELLEDHYNISEKVVYKQISVELSEDIIQSLAQGKIDSAVFFSRNTAKQFSKNIRGLQSNFTAFCLSKQIADSLENHLYGYNINFKISKCPSLSELCKLLLNNDNGVLMPFG